MCAFLRLATGNVIAEWNWFFIADYSVASRWTLSGLARHKALSLLEIPHRYLFLFLFYLSSCPLMFVSSDSPEVKAATGDKGDMTPLTEGLQHLCLQKVPKGRQEEAQKVSFNGQPTKEERTQIKRYKPERDMRSEGKTQGAECGTGKLTLKRRTDMRTKTTDKRDGKTRLKQTSQGSENYSGMGGTNSTIKKAR